MSSKLYQICLLLLYLAKTVIAKECRYIFDNGDIKYFHCSVYEYCCGTMCCRSPAMTFYQMWYFWLMIFLTILFCSGGGWWYKIRNHDGFMTPSNPNRVMPPQLASYYGPARGQGYTQANVYPQNATFPQTTPLAPNTQYPPPPPYYGPPPSYDTVVNQQRQG
ncbi:vesicular, overexpressed in cancer, prosurvival protein 1 [Caerostris darwini]|uniref:WW domain binding protein VOPP1 n=1 Tax=Caerostris darwini TaxID=1538125 RepID=A0AAV4RUD5_9ARAC|nr:vesicular, overexpressed in cancer, prosurvival protein 1 [Caerostris darwini]